MKISYQWLSEYIPQRIDVESLSRILTGIGLEVEGIEKKEAVPGGLEGLVIGRVTSCRPHPEADRLQLTTVDIGQEAALAIVCGAPNVAAGQKVIVAPVGTMLYPSGGAPFKIKKARLRGQVSEGMICAEDEIGLGTAHDGIMVLPDEAPVGQPAKEYWQLPPADYIFQVGLTPNRSDANSHLGVAADVCAYLSYHQQKPVRVAMPPITFSSVPEAPSLPFSVAIQDTTACLRYAGVSIRGVKVAPAPEWLQQRLLAVGVHPVNNIVDITNYLLQLYGQPLHAFDYDKIKGSQIIVRRAAEGSHFTTLDGKERVLRAADLMICDEEEPMCLAGISGGTKSGIQDHTVNVFLESAYFHPRVIRSASLHHGLRTDAATHFEKGVAMKYVLPALQHAVRLIAEITGATAISPVYDFYPEPVRDRKIRLSMDYLNRLAGKQFSAKPVQTIFQALGFTVTEYTEEAMQVTVPGENQDLLQAADLVEEVIRMDGLDRIQIPDRLQISLKRPDIVTGRELKEKIAQYLAGAGLQEIVTNSIANSRYYPDATSRVQLINTLSNELDIMRPRMLESGLEVISYNVNRQMPHQALFEFGKTYAQQAAGQYRETEWLSLWLTGNIQNIHWQHPARKADIFYLKGLLQSVFRLCGLTKFREKTEEDRIVFQLGKQPLATICKVLPGALPSFPLKQTVFYAEVPFGTLLAAVSATEHIKFRELPKYPSVRRDLALVLEKDIAYEQIARVVKNQNWNALKDFELFDIFENEKLGADKKSLALSLTFQLNDRTLTDQEVDQMMQQLMQRYEQELKATVRS